jgi:hypothetical protein
MPLVRLSEPFDYEDFHFRVEARRVSGGLAHIDSHR